MPYSNNHYVPQFILRRFGTKINRYNVKTGDIVVKGSTLNAFSEKEIYPEWLELKLGDLESRIANLIDNKILKATDSVTLTRTENWLIKKFFTIAMLRIPDNFLFTARHLDSEERLKHDGFNEVKIENETLEEYAYRTMKVVLESNSLEDVYNHKEVTYEACKWATLYNNCYVSIWDSSQSKEDFIITDNGMNCEHDKTRFLKFNFNGQLYDNQRDEMLKRGYVIKKIMENANNKTLGFIYANLNESMNYVHANYYLFAVSATRTISLVNPFFRLYYDPMLIYFTKEIPNVWPTILSKEALESNTQSYVNNDKPSPNDLYHYKIKNLSIEDVIIINNMMLDRVNKWMGFENSTRIARSLNVYSLLNKEYQKNNFDKLIEYIYSLGVDFPKKQKYVRIKDKMTAYGFTNEEMEYIEFFYNSIQH